MNEEIGKALKDYWDAKPKVKCRDGCGEFPVEMLNKFGQCIFCHNPLLKALKKRKKR